MSRPDFFPVAKARLAAAPRPQAAAAPRARTKVVAARPSSPALDARGFTAWPLLSALFVAVFGARLWLVHTYGNAVPFWDQWDGEADLLLKPWVTGHLRLRDLFAPHNEHPIFCSRVLALAIFAANGQWDPRLEMVVNAGLCAGLAVAFAAALFRIMHPGDRRPIVLALGLLFALPYAYENTLAGFQSAFYLLLGFSLLAIWGLSTREAFSRGWWAGAAGLILACLSLASGGLAAIAVMGLLILRAAREHRWPVAGERVTMLLCLVILVIGWNLKGYNPAHDALKARSVADFLLMFGRCLAWPFMGQPWAGLWMGAPLVILAAGHWGRRAGSGGAEGLPARTAAVELLLGIGLWLGLQFAAIAHARGSGGIPPPGRYQDLLALGVVLNALAGLWLMRCLSPGSGQRRAAVVLGTAWLLVLANGLTRITVEDLTVGLPARRQLGLVEERNVRGFIATDDAASWLTNKPLLEIPYPLPDRLASLLRDPVIRAILPENVRAPLPLMVETNSAFTPEGYYPTTPTEPGIPSWGSFVPGVGNLSQGELTARLARPGRLPYLRFGFAGYLGGEKDLSLRLRDAAGSGRAVELRPIRAAAEHWRTEYFRAPGTDLRLEAVDHNPAFWFAFQAPVEVGWFSYWSGWLARRGGLLFALGCLGFIVPLVLHWLQRLESFTPQSRVVTLSLLGLVGVLFFRKPAAFLQPQFWAEDATVFFKENYEHGIRAWLIPYAGYLHVLPRLVAWGTGWFPVVLQPALYNAASLLVTLGTAARLFSERLPFTLLQSVAATLSLGLVPHSGEVFLYLAALQWPVALTLPLLAMQRDPSNSWQSAGDYFLLVLAGLTGPFILLFLPLLMLRLLVVGRSWYSFGLLVVGGVLGSIQGACLLSSTRLASGGSGGLDGGVVMEVLGRRLGSYTLLGPQIGAGIGGGVGFLLCFGLFAAPLLLAWREHRRALPMVGGFLAAGMLLVGATLISFRANLSVLLPFENGDRYFYLPRVLLAWSFLLCFGGAGHGKGFARQILAGTVLGLFLMASATNFQSPPPPRLDWTGPAQKLQHGEVVSFEVNPGGPGWVVQLAARPGR